MLPSIIIIRRLSFSFDMLLSIIIIRRLSFSFDERSRLKTRLLADHGKSMANGSYNLTPQIGSPSHILSIDNCHHGLLADFASLLPR